MWSLSVKVSHCTVLTYPSSSCDDVRGDNSNLMRQVRRMAQAP